MYLSNNAMLYIQFTVNQCSTLTYNPRKSHDDAVNRIYRYLIGTQGKGLTFNPNIDMKQDFYVGENIAGL